MECLQRSGARPDRLKLELTEGMLIHDLRDVNTKMASLKAQGIGLSLDDFGTGYSSLNYLRRLPLNQLKIDQTFVQNVLTNENDAAITRTIVSLGQSLGLEVLAEGVETLAQKEFLMGIGCHAFQGYFFSKPLPAQAFEAFVTVCDCA
jgi:EAL domain-containing protein (putative c-di-GMP-specific phosphodiesterase class I)